MIKVMLHLKLLTKHMWGASIERVNVIDAQDARACENMKEGMLDEKMSLLPMYSESSYFPSQGQSGNQGWNNETKACRDAKNMGCINEVILAQILIGVEGSTRW